jgi:hypothetical protein
MSRYVNSAAFDAMGQTLTPAPQGSRQNVSARCKVPCPLFSVQNSQSLGITLPAGTIVEVAPHLSDSPDIMLRWRGGLALTPASNLEFLPRRTLGRAPAPVTATTLAAARALQPAAMAQATAVRPSLGRATRGPTAQAVRNTLVQFLNTSDATKPRWGVPVYVEAGRTAEFLPPPSAPPSNANFVFLRFAGNPNSARGTAADWFLHGQGMFGPPVSPLVVQKVADVAGIDDLVGQTLGKKGRPGTVHALRPTSVTFTEPAGIGARVLSIMVDPGTTAEQAQASDGSTILLRFAGSPQVATGNAADWGGALIVQQVQQPARFLRPRTPPGQGSFSTSIPTTAAATAAVAPRPTLGKVTRGPTAQALRNTLVSFRGADGTWGVPVFIAAGRTAEVLVGPDGTPTWGEHFLFLHLEGSPNNVARGAPADWRLIYQPQQLPHPTPSSSAAVPATGAQLPFSSAFPGTLVRGLPFDAVSGPTSNGGSAPRPLGGSALAPASQLGYMNQFLFRHWPNVGPRGPTGGTSPRGTVAAGPPTPVLQRAAPPHTLGRHGR